MTREMAVELRFWRFVRIDEGGCWEWQGARLDKLPYGVFSVRHRNVPAHRMSWTIHYGPIPAGLYVLHRCDNPPCVRPDHLMLGTARDNTLDMIRKGRHAPLPPRSKLTWEQVEVIRALFRRRIKQKIIAGWFAVTPSNIAQIARRASWRSVP